MRLNAPVLVKRGTGALTIYSNRNLNILSNAHIHHLFHTYYINLRGSIQLFSASAIIFVFVLGVQLEFTIYKFTLKFEVDNL